MKLIKDLNMIPPEWLKDQEKIMQLLSVTKSIGDTGNYWRTATLLLHALDGCQMWVSKEVSDDLRASSIYPEDLDGIDWPYHALEVYYEDPSIPTMLVRRGSNMENGGKIASILGLTPQEFFGALFGKMPDANIILNQFQAENTAGESLSMTLDETNLRDIAADSDTDKLPEQSTPGLFAGPMDMDETKAMTHGVALFLKLLVFVSSEQDAVNRTNQQPTRKQGGKAGFRGRPKTDRLMVVYLPHHKAERARQHREEEGKRAFNGRRGYWRRFKSDFYKAMKGKKTYIYPIMGPDGNYPKTKFVVRNPKP